MSVISLMDLISFFAKTFTEHLYGTPWRTPFTNIEAGIVRLASTYDGDGRKHGRPSYTVLRAEQQTACARLCADVTGEGAAALAFLADGLDADREQVYAALVRAS